MDEIYSNNQGILRILHLQAVALALSALAVQFSIYTGLYELWMPTSANRWLLLSMLITVYITDTLLRGVPLITYPVKTKFYLHSAGETLRPCYAVS